MFCAHQSKTQLRNMEGGGHVYFDYQKLGREVEI